MQILPFKSSNTASSSCNYCKIQKYYIWNYFQRG
jgi:hypothetical protein